MNEGENNTQKHNDRPRENIKSSQVERSKNIVKLEHDSTSKIHDFDNECAYKPKNSPLAPKIVPYKVN